jgi:hypothetical protein
MKKHPLRVGDHVRLIMNPYPKDWSDAFYRSLTPLRVLEKKTEDGVFFVRTDKAGSTWLRAKFFARYCPHKHPIQAIRSRLRDIIIKKKTIF